MSDLISRQAAIDAVKGRFSMPVDNLIVEVIGALPSAQPTIDAVEVILCKDCKYNKGTKIWLDGDVTIDCDNGMGYPPPDWFCADGEMKHE